MPLPSSPEPGLVVGFDLDLTLVDSRPGIEASLRALAAETGRPVDAVAVVRRLGPPLTDELARWFDDDEIDDALARFRAHMAASGASLVTALPGASDALDAVHALGGTTVVVTAKHQPLAEQTLRSAGLAPTLVVGDHWGVGKGDALTRLGASIYVGDHPADVLGARAAGATAVLVRTSQYLGSLSADDIEQAEADVVLDDLLQFRRWLLARPDILVTGG